MMMLQTMKLYEQIDATLQRMPETGPTGSRLDQPQLEREEIAKLLLLSSRAYGIQQISSEQYRSVVQCGVCILLTSALFIRTVKNAICKRDGKLRSILQQSDIANVMMALSSIGEEKV